MRIVSVDLQFVATDDEVFIVKFRSAIFAPMFGEILFRNGDSPIPDEMK